jgi:predicted NBD/HSP70 family sugar kinase
VSGRAELLLGLVHAEPAITRTEAGRRLGLGTGAMTDLVSRLAAAELVSEGLVTPTGQPGRPTRPLIAHPAGPLVLAGSITRESWRLDVVELGGRTVTAVSDAHDGYGRPDCVISEMRHAIRRLRRRFGNRLAGCGLSVPGTVRDGHLLDASGLAWRDVDMCALAPAWGSFVLENDATAAALGEARRGEARAATLALHLRIEGGLGGAVVDHGRIVGGAQGLSGEFGHLPFGDPQVTCPCGARGCWGTAVDGTALARLLGARTPRRPVTYATEVLRRASMGDQPARAAVDVVAEGLGRGVAGLVNGLDPDLVTLGGLGIDIVTLAPRAFGASYRAGLMRFRRADPPPVMAASLGVDGPLVGTAERIWDLVLPGLLR